jgi:tetratricopeptide (TPR) repeat protein
MRITGWLITAAVAAMPAMARAQAVLDRPHQILGEGVSRVVAGKYQEAIPKLQEALRQNPTLRNAHYNLGVAYRNLGDYDSAIVEFQRALPMFGTEEPGYAQSLYGMSLAKEARGDRDPWHDYLAFARIRPSEQAGMQVAMERAAIDRTIVPGTQKANR